MLLVCLGAEAQVTSYATLPYTTGFESGALDANWATLTSPTGRVRPHLDSSLTWSNQAARSFSGDYFLGLDDSIGGSFTTQAALMGLNLSGQSGVTLDFEWAEWNDESQPEDGIFFSDNGGASYVKVLDLPGTAYPDLVYTHFTLNVDSLATANGLTLSSTFVVKFQQHDNFYFAGGNDGFLFDDIAVTAAANCNASLNCPPSTVVSAGAGCDAVVNYNTPTVQSDCYQSLLITEANSNSPDMLEIQNMQNATVNYAGFVAVISDSYTNINVFNSTLWQLGSFTPGQYQTRDDGGGSPNPWGSNMFWNSTSSSWAMILDPSGNVVDAVFWGWDSVAIAGFNATIAGNVVTIPPSVWSGNGVPTSCSGSYARQGTSDNNTAADWACIPVSTGTQNPGWNPTIGGGGSGSPPAPTLASGLASGATFPIGTTTNNWTWSDPNLGVSGNCSFTVTVVDSAAPTALCQNATVQLMPSGMASVTASQIDAGSSDNCSVASTTLNQSTFTCADLGAAPVILTVTDSSGNTNTCTATVAVVDTIGATAVPVNLGPNGQICDGAPTTLDAGAGQASYIWSTGDTSQAIVVTTGGSYGVTVTSSQGCTGSDIIALTAYTVPASNPMPTGGAAVLCTGGTIDLTANAGYTSYFWSTGSTSQTTQVSTAGTITVNVTDSTGCSRTDSIVITAVNAPAPVANVTPAGNPVYGCDGDPVVLDAGSGFAGYSWSNGGATQSITVNAGNYSVTVTDPNGCWDASPSIQVVDTSATVPVLSVVGDSICAPPATAYSWTFNGSPIAATTQCIFASQVGTYECTVTEATGCTATGTILYVSIEDGMNNGLFADAAPNPFQESTQISFETPYLCHATLKVFALDGSHVATLFDGEMAAATRQQAEFRPEGISQGMYVYRFVTDQGDVLTGKVILMK